MNLINFFLEKYKPYVKNKRFVVSIAISFLLLIVSIIIAYFAIMYATESASYPVTDIILSNIPVFDLDDVFKYGPVLFWIIIVIYLFFEPKNIPFTFKSIAFFTLVRSFFITLTHIGPFPTHININAEGILGVLNSGNDLFFSGHVGTPFLMALVFWNNKYLRWFSIISSIFFAVVVLLTHLHYSIDVFAAFFIAYAIFHLSEWLFKKDRKIFIDGLEN